MGLSEETEDFRNRRSPIGITGILVKVSGHSSRMIEFHLYPKYDHRNARNTGLRI
jgi:hypothetical protein